MNKVILIGRLVKEPILKFIPTTGTATCSITIAVDNYNSKTGEKSADFIPVVIFGKQAENLVQFMTKGNQVAVSGKIRIRSYDSKDGIKKYVTEVLADNFGGIKFLGSNSSTNNALNEDETFNDSFIPEDMGECPF